MEKEVISLPHIISNVRVYRVTPFLVTFFELKKVTAVRTGQREEGSGLMVEG